MRVKMILPALTEATSPFFRPLKYSLFPPLGLATLAGYLEDGDEIDLQDEHVEPLDLTDKPDLVVLEAYITSAHRAYEIADHYGRKGVPVALGGLHVTALPNEAARHADTIFLGPGEDTWPQFLADFRAGHPKRLYRSTQRTLIGAPRPRRDLIKRRLYLIPNSLVVSRGCPHRCDFCYTSSFFKGGKSFYTQRVDAVLREVESLPGRHLYFLDDNLFGDEHFAEALILGLRGMGRIWQAAATLKAVLKPTLMERAAAAGLRSCFLGFETLNRRSLQEQGKTHNLDRDYGKALRRLRDLGVMVNGSFVFGMDHDDPDVFDRTVEWAVSQGMETATFHILTPYPGTRLHDRLARDGRLLHSNWNLYDTRHAVFRPARMSPAQLEEGYWHAYDQFYRWRNLVQAAGTKDTAKAKLRHLAYAAGWKKMEPLWNLAIRARRVVSFLPVLEAVLGRGGNTQEPTPEASLGRLSGASVRLHPELS